MENVIAGKIETGFVAENSEKFGSITNKEASLTSTLSGLIRGRFIAKVGDWIVYEDSGYADILKTTPNKLFEWKVQLLNPPKIIIKDDPINPAFKEIVITSDDEKIFGNLYFYYNIGDTTATTADIAVSGITNHQPVLQLTSGPIRIEGNKVIKARALLLNKDVSDSIWSWGTSVSVQANLEVANIAKPLMTPVAQSFVGQLTITLSQSQGDDIYYKLNNGAIIKYSGPFNLTDSATITAYSEVDLNNHKERSESVVQIYTKCADTQKLENNVCVDLTCELDNYNCPTCKADETLMYYTDGSGYCSLDSVVVVPSGNDCVKSYDGFSYQIDTNHVANDDTYISCLYGFDGKLDWQEPYVNGKKDGLAIGYGLYVVGAEYRKITYSNGVVVRDCWLGYSAGSDNMSWECY